MSGNSSHAPGGRDGDGLARRLPAAGILAAVAGLGTLVAIGTGTAPVPGILPVALSLLAGALLGVAAHPLFRAAYLTAVPSRHEASPVPSVPRRHRVVAVAVASVVLAVICWVHPGEPGRVVFGLVEGLLGLLAYAVPVLPALGLVAVPGTRRDRTPWATLVADRSPAALRRLAGAWTAALRDTLLGRPVGTALATAALIHLARDRPGIDAGAHRLAGGLAGIVLGEPLAVVLSPAGAAGVLTAVLAAVALVWVGHLSAVLRTGRLRRGQAPWRASGPAGRRVIRSVAVGALVLLLVGPLAAAAVLGRVGYRWFLGLEGDRVVVVAGLGPHHRHEVDPTPQTLTDLPEPVHPLLRAGLPVADRADGRRVAAALADPALVAAPDGLPDGTVTLRAGECFSAVGGDAGFRYPAPCNAEHTGEVFYVGRLPFRADPGAAVAAAAARGICERAYGGYLGTPYGTSYLPMDPPVTGRGLVACVFPGTGPWSLRGTRTVAALGQRLDWAPAGRPGCAAEPGPRLVAGGPGLVCVSPGSAARAAARVPIALDVEYAPLGGAAAGGRVGAACTRPDAATGYYATVGGDGVLAVVRQDPGGVRTVLGTGGRAGTSSAPSPQAAATRLQLVCAPAGPAVQITATAGKGRQVAVADPAGLTPLGPRLVVESDGVPVAATVTLFTAVAAEPAR